MKTQPITGFGIGGYRSFSGEPQIIGPFQKINIFIGENNSGKSNVLRFIRDVYLPISGKQGTARPISASDRPQGGRNSPIVPIMLPASVDHIKSLGSTLENHHAAVIKQVLMDDPAKNYCIIPFLLSNNTIAPDIEQSHNRIPYDQRHLVSQTWSKVTGRMHGDIKLHWIPELMDWFYKSSLQSPALYYVPTLRQIPTKLQEFEQEYGGITTTRTIADELAAIFQPDYKRPGDRAKFDAITEFMRSVLKRPGLKLSVPHDKSTIIIEDYHRYLPIETLGTGIHQLLILATRAALMENSVICIEEPELHLHPELQQQLMHFINATTSNQYFITTHSATIMDAVGADVYSVRLDNGFSKIERPLTRNARRDICHNLGYRPSDLLQANSVIWVEGPTDRLYLLNWLNSIASHLEEGWHFSIMFYGGKLASHLTATDSIGEFIDLLPINRFPAIIMDSDKKKKGQQISATKERLRDEFAKAGGFAWVTKGREIENYLSAHVRQDILAEVAGVEHRIASNDEQYGHPLEYAQSGKNNIPDKIQFAKAACRNPLSVEIFDLKDQLTRLVQFICRANRIGHV